MTQEAIHNSLPILEEIVALIEKDEDEMLQKEIDKRRQRLNAPRLEELKKEVEREILGTSKAMSFNGSAVSVLIQVDL